MLEKWSMSFMDTKSVFTWVYTTNVLQTSQQVEDIELNITEAKYRKGKVVNDEWPLVQLLCLCFCLQQHVMSLQCHEQLAELMVVGWHVGRAGLMSRIWWQHVFDIHMLMSLSWTKSRSYSLVTMKKYDTHSTSEQVHNIAEQNIYEAYKLFFRDVLLFNTMTKTGQLAQHIYMGECRRQSLGCTENGKRKCGR